MTLDFNNKEEVLALAKKCELYGEAEKLKQLLKDNLEMRNPFYLELNELNRILKFKLRNQYNRQASIRQLNEEQLVRRVTILALNIHTQNERYTDEIRVKVLSALKGINVPTASAILALTFPKDYAIIDRKNWRYLNPDNPKTNFTVNDYLKYLDLIRKKSRELAVDAQVIDMAIWQRETEK